MRLSTCHISTWGNYAQLGLDRFHYEGQVSGEIILLIAKHLEYVESTDKVLQMKHVDYRQGNSAPFKAYLSIDAIGRQ